MLESVLYTAMFLFIGMFNATVAVSKYVRSGKWGWRFAFCTGAVPAIATASLLNIFFGIVVACVVAYMLINPWD